MPIYEYACEKCSNRYEKRESFDAPARQRCPKCRGTALRVLHAPPIVFKGSGFYVTDSRKSESGVVGESSGEIGKSDTSESKPEKSDKKDSGSTTTEAAAAG
jgi:putative FmdB family regulatory protein